MVPGGSQADSEQRQLPQPIQHTSQNKTVKDIIKFISEKWSVRQRQIDLRLCQSAADLVTQDPRNLIKYDKHNSMSVKISDLLPRKFHHSQEACTLYLLYEIKRDLEDDEEEEEGSDSEENEEDEVEGSEEMDSENEETPSQRDRSSQKGAKGPAKDDEE